MLTEIDPHNLPHFPKRIPEKLKTIRDHLGLTLDEIAPMVGARTGAEILAYENDEDDLLVTVLWNYSKIAGCPIDQILYDNLEVTFRDLSASDLLMPPSHSVVLLFVIGFLPTIPLDLSLITFS